MHIIYSTMFLNVIIKQLTTFQLTPPNLGIVVYV